MELLLIETIYHVKLKELSNYLQNVNNHAWKISNQGQRCLSSMPIRIERSIPFFLYALSKRYVWLNCIVVKPSIPVTTRNESAYESRKPRSQCVKHKKASNRSCFVIFLSFVSPILSIRTEYQIETRFEEPTTRSYRQIKKKNKKNKKNPAFVRVLCPR